MASRSVYELHSFSQVSNTHTLFPLLFEHGLTCNTDVLTSILQYRVQTQVTAHGWLVDILVYNRYRVRQGGGPQLRVHSGGVHCEGSSWSEIHLLSQLRGCACGRVSQWTGSSHIEGALLVNIVRQHVPRSFYASTPHCCKDTSSSREVNSMQVMVQSLCMSLLPSLPTQIDVCTNVPSVLRHRISCSKSVVHICICILAASHVRFSMHTTTASCSCCPSRSLRNTWLFSGQDHKATDAEEITRIESAGGFVLRSRVMGVLAVARSFGDFVLKKYVSAEPFTSATRLDATVGSSNSQLH
jgi:hypothetical protein